MGTLYKHVRDKHNGVRKLPRPLVEYFVDKTLYRQDRRPNLPRYSQAQNNLFNTASQTADTNRQSVGEPTTSTFSLEEVAKMIAAAKAETAQGKQNYLLNVKKSKAN